MSMNSSSSSDVLNSCLDSRPGNLIFAAFSASNIFLIPPFVLVLCTGCQRWRKQRSGSTAVTTSHSDVFTYHVIVLELVSLLGCFLFSFGLLRDTASMTRVGLDIFSFTSPGQSLFHVLTCVERHLAVVYPITYRRLRRAGGVRIRNAGVGGVWLLCLVSLFKIEVFSPPTVLILATGFLVFLMLAVSFCSLSVLWVLIRPGPGEGGGDRERADQSKRRAFYTITVIMGVLWLRFVGVLAGFLITRAEPTDSLCAVGSAVSWLTMPGSLVLPLLYLHRAGKLPGCKRSAASG